MMVMGPRLACGKITALIHTYPRFVHPVSASKILSSDDPIYHAPCDHYRSGDLIAVASYVHCMKLIGLL
jgi:hypothetical protein